MLHRQSCLLRSPILKSRRIGSCDRDHRLPEPDPFQSTSSAAARGWLRNLRCACRKACTPEPIEEGSSNYGYNHSRACGAAGLALTVAALPAVAGPTDYAFEPVKVDVKNGRGSELAVRIVHKPTGKPVEGVVLFRTRLDMSPDSMGEMTAKHTAQPSSEPGVYKFRPI